MNIIRFGTIRWTVSDMKQSGNNMKRIKEIIAYIMDMENGVIDDPAGMHSDLENLGYSAEEINHALNMLEFPDPEEDIFLEPSAYVTNNRILGEAEKMILTMKAQGFLIRLKSTGWLTEAQLGLVIENAGLEYSTPVSLDEIMEITSRYVPEIPEKVLDGYGGGSDNFN